MSDVTLILQITGVVAVALLAASEWAARSVGDLEARFEGVTKIASFDALRRFEEFLASLEAFENRTMKALTVRDEFFIPAELVDNAVVADWNCRGASRSMEASAPCR